MNTWGFGIRDSEDALAWEDELYALVGINPSDDFFNRSSDYTREALERGLPFLLRHVGERGAAADTYLQAVGYQVLALMLIQARCYMSDEQIQALIRGASSCSEYQAILRLEQLAKNRQLTKEFMHDWGAASGLVNFESALPRFLGRKQTIETLCSLLREHLSTGSAPLTKASDSDELIAA